MGNKNILFITNGNTHTGFGHISRSLLLAEEFAAAGCSVSLLVEESCSFKLVISQKGFGPATVLSFEEAVANGELATHITRNSINTVILDVTENDYNKLRPLRNIISSGVLFVSITLFLFDVNNRFEDLSFFPDFDETQTEVYPTESGKVTILKGKDYFTFRPEFRETGTVAEADKKDVLITMGGSDPEGFTLKTLQSLAGSGILISAILSPVAKTYDAVVALAESKSNVEIITRTDNIAKVMASHKLILLNGGLTRYEACAAGTPFIAISIHKVQYNITEKITKNGVGINLGIGSELTEDAIYNATVSLLHDLAQRQEMASKMKNLIDLNGSSRIVKAVLGYQQYA